METLEETNFCLNGLCPVALLTIWNDSSSCWNKWRILCCLISAFVFVLVWAKWWRWIESNEESFVLQSSGRDEDQRSSSYWKSLFCWVQMNRKHCQSVASIEEKRWEQWSDLGECRLSKELLAQLSPNGKPTKEKIASSSHLQAKKWRVVHFMKRVLAKMSSDFSAISWKMESSSLLLKSVQSFIEKSLINWRADNVVLLNELPQNELIDKKENLFSYSCSLMVPCR